MRGIQGDRTGPKAGFTAGMISVQFKNNRLVVWLGTDAARVSLFIMLCCCSELAVGWRQCWL